MTDASDVSRGFIYIATGEQFVQEARLSAQTVHQHMPDIPITLVTDSKNDFDEFDEVHVVDNPSYGFDDQIKYLCDSPYDLTVFLDTDIHVAADISDLFSILNEFDIAAAHNHDRGAFIPDGVPDAFPEYNTGVLPYRNDEKMVAFCDSWRRNYESVPKPPSGQNQPSFQKTLYHSDLRLATLPPEYNCMVRYPGHAIGKIKVFHGRLLDIDTPGAGEYVSMETAVSKLNRTEQHRVFTQLGGLRVKTNRRDTLIGETILSIQKYGIRHTLYQAFKKLQNGNRS